MFIIKVPDEPFQCVIRVLGVCLMLTLELFFNQGLQEVLLEDVLLIYHLVPLVHLGRINLDWPWDFFWSWIGWSWSFFWRTCREFKFVPSDCSVCVWLYLHPKETILYYPKFWLNGWRIGLNFVMHFTDDLVIDEPFTFYNFLEENISANVFGFGSHYLFRFHQVWWDDSCRGSLLPCLVASDFSKFGWLGRVGDQICCAWLILVFQTSVVA